ncbi:M20 family metallopeptidase [Erythrobacter sp. QSSC1-22B]|uniref:M20 family metallopeptidase n=1 Tax=Erythrobacter sp. QSSC1-22B TaxID=1860125 RepID=UPI000A7AF854|nr:M20 family metallopeptidase [Erythrobacter sp. QSSC1-22B]
MRLEHDAVELTRKLVGENSINPPGDEHACASLLAALLERHGWNVKLQSFGPRRVNLIARIGGSDTKADPLVLTGHLDTVPLGETRWTADPFGGETSEGRMYGRGTSDMKAGVAAMICAALPFAQKSHARRGITLIFTGGEETGCEGAIALRQNMQLGRASAILVGEPTANGMSLGHKGCLCFNASAKGVTAHSSMPDLGSNAIYEIAEAVLAARDVDWSRYSQSELGNPSLNVGTIRGGLNFNSVPDAAECTIDIRTTDTMDHAVVSADLRKRLGERICLKSLIDMPAILTSKDEPFVAVVAEVLNDIVDSGAGAAVEPMSFFTDASVLQSEMVAPTILLGPGQPELAHQTDEWCSIERIRQAVSIYENIIDRWCQQC